MNTQHTPALERRIQIQNLMILRSITEVDKANKKLKIHYIGYSTCFDEWRPFGLLESFSGFFIHSQLLASCTSDSYNLLFLPLTGCSHLNLVVIHLKSMPSTGNPSSRFEIRLINSLPHLL